MNKKITALSVIAVFVALFFGVSLTRGSEKAVTATNDTCALGEEIASVIGGDGSGLGDILGGSSGGLGDVLGGIGDALGGLGDLGNLGDRFNSTTTTTQRVTYNIETIVPLVTKAELSTIFEATTESTTEPTTAEAETVSESETTEESTESAAVISTAESTTEESTGTLGVDTEKTIKIIAIVISIVAVWAVVVGGIVLVRGRRRQRRN